MGETRIERLLRQVTVIVPHERGGRPRCRDHHECVHLVWPGPHLGTPPVINREGLVGLYDEMVLLH